jgi:hypothetical protein
MSKLFLRELDLSFLLLAHFWNYFGLFLLNDLKLFRNGRLRKGFWLLLGQGLY